MAKKAVKKKSSAAGKKTSVAVKSHAIVGRPSASEEHLALWKKPMKELENLMQTGKAPTPAQLSGWRFRGLNVGIGAKILGIRKFIKVFDTVDYGYGTMITGHNIVVKQSAAEKPYEKILKKGKHKIQGVYLVEADNPNYQQFDSAALLNYGRGDNPWWEVAKRLRDYLVQPFPENPNLLLGKAYFALGPFRIFGGYFVLERLEKTSQP